MINETKQQEIEHLTRLYQLIEQKYKNVSDSASSDASELTEMKKYIWDNLSEMDSAEKALNRAQMYDIKSTSENTLSIKKNLEKILKSPYFARIDFQAEGEELLPVYIGIRGFLEDISKQVLIYDWRAPISSVFYDFEKGTAHYKAPKGSIIGELLLKRQYKTNHDTLEYMIESSVSVDDEILQKELSSTSDEKMKNIVATIQKEQNAIIRNEDAHVLIIQGAAGSGKTSIALHRIAFMLYRFKHTIQSSDMLVLSPNKVFSDYISNVLPELGEDNIQEIGFEEIALEILGHKYTFQNFSAQVSSLLDHDDAAFKNRIEYKASVPFMKELTKYLQTLEDNYFTPRQIKIKNVVLPKEKIISYMQGLSTMSLKSKMEKTGKDLSQKMKTLFLKHHLEWEISYDVRIKREIRDMFLFKNEMEIYRHFFNLKDVPELFSLLNKNTLEYSDVFPLALCKLYFEDIPDYQYVKHLLVDEMQDYTPVQYQVLKKLFPCKMTILGDSYQAVNPYSASSLAKIQSVFPDSQGITLCKSYRSTLEIVEFAQSISPNPDIIPMERHGEKPLLLFCKNENDQFKKLRSMILEFSESTYTNLGIICRTQSMAESFYHVLKDLPNVHLLDFSSNHFEEGIIITTSHMSKGLEFDQVFIPNVSKNEYQTEIDRKLLYVASTRAMHKLDLSYIGSLSDLIPIS